MEIVEKIKKILIPEEYTRLDKIIDMAFSAIEEGLSQASSIQSEPENQNEDNNINSREINKDKNKQQHLDSFKLAEKKLKINLIKENRSVYSNVESETFVLCKVSKIYKKPDNIESYWFGFHFSQKELLESIKNGFMLLGCDNNKQVFLLPFKEFKKQIEKLNITETENSHYHIVINKISNDFFFIIPNSESININCKE